MCRPRTAHGVGGWGRSEAKPPDAANAGSSRWSIPATPRRKAVSKLRQTGKPDLREMKSMKRFLQFCVVVALLFGFVGEAAAQRVEPLRQFPNLQFRSRSFTGFQFRNGGNLGRVISFRGIQFPGFGLRFDQNTPGNRQTDVDDYRFQYRNPEVAAATTSRFFRSTRPAPFVVPSSMSRRSDRRDPFSFREPRYDTSDRGETAAVDHIRLTRHRRPFGPLSTEVIAVRQRTFRSASPSRQRVAGGISDRRRPFE